MNEIVNNYILETEGMTTTLLNSWKKLKGNPQKIEHIEEKNRIKSSYLDEFVITETDEVLFKSIKDLESYKKTILDMKDIFIFLEENNFKNAETISKILKKYEQDAEKFISNLKEKSIDEDEFSDEFTRKLRDLVNKGIIEKLFDSLNYEVKNKNITAFELLEKIKKYLIEIGIYSGNIPNIGEKISEEIYDYYNLKVEKISDEKMHDTIKSVEMLPYFINYYDSNEERERYYIQGKLTIYSSKI